MKKLITALLFALTGSMAFALPAGYQKQPNPSRPNAQTFVNAQKEAVFTFEKIEYDKILSAKEVVKATASDINCPVDKIFGDDITAGVDNCLQDGVTINLLIHMEGTTMTMYIINNNVSDDELTEFMKEFGWKK